MRPSVLILAVWVLVSTQLVRATPTRAASIDATAIEKSLGLRGRWMEREKVFRIDLDRDSWLAFKSGREGMVILTGQLFLRGSEVNPAVSATVEGTIQVTSLVVATPLTNPPTYAMFVTGDAAGATLATDARKLLDAMKRAKGEATDGDRGDSDRKDEAAAMRAGSTPEASSPPRASAPPQSTSLSPPPQSSSITPAALDPIFGSPAGRGDDRGRYVVSVGREVAMPCACTIGVEMGVASTATFTGSDDRADVTGQVACAFGELQNVLRALRSGGLDVTAVHNHLDGEAPRMLFAHFRGTGKAGDLARKVKSAFDAASKRPATPAAGGAGHEHHH